MKTGTRLLIVVVLLTAPLAYMIADKQFTLVKGTEVLLEIEARDPRSLFRGDYVNLNYAIGSIDLHRLEGDNDFEEYDSVYLTLQPDTPYWKPVAAHKQLPVLETTQVALKGKVRRVTKGDEPEWDMVTLEVRYGLETFFIPEDTGLALEKLLRDTDKVAIKIAVDHRGKSGILAILINGEERYTETLF